MLIIDKGKHSNHYFSLFMIFLIFWHILFILTNLLFIQLKKRKQFGKT